MEDQMLSHSGVELIPVNKWFPGSLAFASAYLLSHRRIKPCAQ